MTSKINSDDIILKSYSQCNIEETNQKSEKYKQRIKILKDFNKLIITQNNELKNTIKNKEEEQNIEIQDLISENKNKNQEIKNRIQENFVLEEGKSLLDEENYEQTEIIKDLNIDLTEQKKYYKQKVTILKKNQKSIFIVAVIAICVLGLWIGFLKHRFDHVQESLKKQTLQIQVNEFQEKELGKLIEENNYQRIELEKIIEENKHLKNELEKKTTEKNKSGQSYYELFYILCIIGYCYCLHIIKK